MTDYSSYTLEQLISTRQKLAETVNRQMRRWAAAGMGGKASAFTKYAEPYLRQFTNPRTGKPLERFHTGKKPISGRTEYQQRRAEMRELAALERLLNAPTYTITGYNKIKRKALEGLARAAGIDINTPEGRKFIEETAETLVGSDQFAWLKRTVGSEAILEVSKQIAKGNATRDEVLQRITEMRAKDTAGRTYVDYRGQPHAVEPEKWTETVERTDPKTGEIKYEKVERERSIYTDAPLEIVYEQLGFSDYQNIYGEEYEA